MPISYIVASLRLLRKLISRPDSMMIYDETYCRSFAHLKDLSILDKVFGIGTGICPRSEEVNGCQQGWFIKHMEVLWWKSNSAMVHVR